MNYFLRFGAYLFHPLLMPLLGVSIYYLISPRFLQPEIIQAKIAAVVILTVFIPLLIFFLLKNLRLVSSIHLREVSERKLPLFIQCALLLLIIKFVYDPYDSGELYYFFIGILFTTITALLLVFLKFKVSLHQMAIAGITLFTLGLSVHFKINLLVWIGVLLLGNGWVASSRLHTKSHTVIELVIGFFVGAIPQLVLYNYWL